MQTPSSLQNLGGRQLAGLQAGGGGAVQTPSTQVLGARQLRGLQAGGRPRSTVSLSDTVMSPRLMVSERGPVDALLARSNDRIRLCALGLLTRSPLTPSPGVTLNCDAAICDRSRKPLLATVNAGEVPVLTVFGVTLMGAWACAAEAKRQRIAIAAKPASDRNLALVVMIAPLPEEPG
jgi:hypothetical protein